MNIVFLGSAHFGLASLKDLLESRHKVSCVVTQPDKHAGRGLPVVSTAIKQFSLEKKIRVYQPETINSPDSVGFLKSLAPDLLVIIAYGQLLSTEVLSIPKIFCVNLHASLLPKYRGAGPINWALINGEEATGVTVMKVIRKMDAGPVILQKRVVIRREDDYLSLESRLSEAGGPLLLDAINRIEDSKFTLNAQDESGVTYAPKLKKESGRISWQAENLQIYNLVRGCIVWPGAFTLFRGKLLKIYKARPVPAPGKQKATAGEIVAVTKWGITVATGQGNFVIEELQIESKRRMKISEFVAGHKVLAGEVLGK